MAVLPIHRYFIYDGEIRPNTRFIASENEGGVYEVLRVIKGVPLFLEDHLRRFFYSARLASKKIRFSEKDISDMLSLLIRDNQEFEGNILISCKEHLKAFFITHSYPTPEMYQNGVECGILRAERENPNAKVFQTSVRQKANSMMEESGYYEVLLMDHSGRITEGSRSNLFFISGNMLVTPPGNEVLLGITRQKTIGIASKLEVAIEERDVYFSDLASYDAVFITGTSPKILPVKKVERMEFDSSDVLLSRLIRTYDELIESYIRRNST